MDLRVLLLNVLFVASVTCASLKNCCPDVGCYNQNPPFNNMPLPECPALLGMSYTLYTPTNKNVGVTLTKDSIPGQFSSGRETVFIIHGWNSSPDSAWMSAMKDAFLNTGSYNIVIVGWPIGAGHLNYNQCASNTRTAGAYTALVMNNLKTNGGLSVNNLYCVGHSLGAHHCGHAGANTAVGRITGMDPAGLAFEGQADWTVGLNPTCATLVDVMHTNGVKVGNAPTNYGTMKPLGDIDFYPAGGQSQPGCDGIDPGNCSHGRAHTYFITSITNNCFLVHYTDCSDEYTLPGSCTFRAAVQSGMGFSARNYSARGKLYLPISASAPHC